MIVTRRQALTLLAASAATSTLIAANAPAGAAVQTGRPAPDFTATDSKGAQHTLAAYRGRTVIIEWTNHECPYTAKHYATGNMQALQAATIVPARVMKADKDSGTVEVGKRADFDILDANPLENISNVRTVHRVVASGILYESAPLWESVGFKR